MYFYTLILMWYVWCLSLYMRHLLHVIFALYVLTLYIVNYGDRIKYTIYTRYVWWGRKNKYLSLKSTEPKLKQGEKHIFIN